MVLVLSPSALTPSPEGPQECGVKKGSRQGSPSLPPLPKWNRAHSPGTLQGGREGALQMPLRLLLPQLLPNRL